MQIKKGVVVSEQVPIFLSVPELAELTGLSAAFWRKQIFFKKIPYFKIGSAVRVRRADAEEWLAERDVCS